MCTIASRNLIQFFLLILLIIEPLFFIENEKKNVNQDENL